MRKSKYYSPDSDSLHAASRPLSLVAIGTGLGALCLAALALFLGVLLSDAGGAGKEHALLPWIRVALSMAGGGALTFGLAAGLLRVYAVVFRPLAVGVSGARVGLFAVAAGLAALFIGMPRDGASEPTPPAKGMAETAPAEAAHPATPAIWGQRERQLLWESDLAILETAVASERGRLESTQQARVEEERRVAEKRLELARLRQEIEKAETEVEELAARRAETEEALESLRRSLASPQTEMRSMEERLPEAGDGREAAETSGGGRIATPPDSRDAGAAKAPEPQRFPLRPGQSLDLSVHGATVEVWSDGRTRMRGDYTRYLHPVAAGHRVRFQGHQVISIAPMEPAATEIYLLKVEGDGTSDGGD